MKRLVLASVIAAFAFGVTAPVVSGLGESDAYAQKKNNKKKKAKVYDFSGDDITGELIRPDGDGMNARGFVNHTSLIRLRTNFIKEILKSAEDL